MGVTEILDYGIIVILGLIMLWLMMKTEALKMVLGILIIYFLALVSGAVGLKNTGAILEKATNTLIIGMVVIFTPELRMALKKIGGRITNLNAQEEQIVSSIEEAVFSLAEKKIGALIILDQHKRLGAYVENAVAVDAKCSKELLETIFHPNTKLHDGAVVIQNDRIVYAGCKLPISGKKQKGLEHMGTRHIAAIESAERHDITVIVVSEETGNVSVATSRGLYRVKSKLMFERFFKEEKEKKTTFKNFFKKKRK